MKGRNEIHLCAAEMIHAMQAWADDKLNSKVIVTGVNRVALGADVTFVIQIEEASPKPETTVDNQ